MSILVTPTNQATAQAEDKRNALALVLALVVICLFSLVLVFASEPFAQAVELTGRMM